MGLEVFKVFANIVDFVNGHPAQSAAPDGTGLVQAEVNARVFAKQRKDSLVSALGFRFFLGTWFFTLAEVRMEANPDQLLCDFLRGQDKIHALSIDCAAGHTIVFGRAGSLGKSN